jgi:hypothetical protein
VSNSNFCAEPPGIVCFTTVIDPGVGGGVDVALYTWIWLIAGNGGPAAFGSLPAAHSTIRWVPAPRVRTPLFTFPAFTQRVAVPPLIVTL